MVYLSVCCVLLLSMCVFWQYHLLQSCAWSISTTRSQSKHCELGPTHATFRCAPSGIRRGGPRWTCLCGLVVRFECDLILFGFPFGLSAVFCLSTVDHLVYVLDLDEAICAGRRSSPGVSPRAEWTLG